MFLSFLWTLINALFELTWPYSLLLFFVVYFVHLSLSVYLRKKLRNGSYVYEPFSFTLKKKWSGQASSAVAITTVLVVVPERVLQSSLAPHPLLVLKCLVCRWASEPSVSWRQRCRGPVIRHLDECSGCRHSLAAETPPSQPGSSP